MTTPPRVHLDQAAGPPRVNRFSRRDLVLGIVAGVIAVGLIVLAILNMSRGVSGRGLAGRITEKHFTPQEPSTEISIGKGGLSARSVDGIYTFVVWVESEKKFFTVWVDRRIYESKKVGDTFFFVRPPVEEPSARHAAPPERR